MEDCCHSNNNCVSSVTNGTSNDQEQLSSVDEPGKREPEACPQMKASDSGADGSCGVCCFQPPFLQKLARPATVLACLCLLVLAQSILASGYISGILTTIERRFNLRSSQAGIVLSSYEFTCLLGVVLVSFYGDRFNRAHILAAGALIMALGSLIFTFPHFLGDNYTVKNLDNQTSGLLLCVNKTHSESDLGCQVGQEVTFAFVVFLIAQLVIGFGASPVYILGPTYLHDNVWHNWFPVFAGVFFACAALGPAGGFLLGATFVSIFVDTPIAPPVGLTEDDHLWVGAWWIGFLVTMAMLLVVGFMLMLLPRQLASVQCDKDAAPDKMGFGNSCAGIPRLIHDVFMRPTWLLVSLAVVAEQSVITGFINFIAKFTQTAFSLPASQANIIAGGVLIPAAALGILTGGVVMKRLQPSLVVAIKLMVIIAAVSLVCAGLLMLFTCDTIHLAGVTQSYSSSESDIDLLSVCNTNCSCLSGRYEPVCGSDHVTYFSACHAGCQSSPIGGALESSDLNFTSCDCPTGHYALSGRCPSTCTMLVPFLVMLFFTIFVTCLGHNPALVITLSSVAPHQRSFALGAQYFLVRCLAFIPAPIYFGNLFDSQCLLWEDRCGQQGACLEYNVGHLPYYMFGVCCGFKLLTLVFCSLAYFAARKPNSYTVTSTTISELSTPDVSTTPTTPGGDSSDTYI